MARARARAREGEGALSPHREVARTMESEGGVLSSRGGWRQSVKVGSAKRFLNSFDTAILIVCPCLPPLRPIFVIFWAWASCARL